MCVFSHIASEFKTGDICTEDSDHRNQLLSLEGCKQLIEDYCVEMNFRLVILFLVGFGKLYT
ncbi:hypothetical protein [Clostridium chromiireducens]|uniref:hypothetical protein n=1 Tax=Clostridium chromiireducens TaxID=225345 RepID=UPI001474648B|nr:hypothetical protein [Clostridium chromiireducens]